MQYTLRNVPAKVDRALRKKAKAERRSLNAVAVEALAVASGVSNSPVERIDLNGIAGTWVEDPAFDQIMSEQDRVDPEMWK